MNVLSRRVRERSISNIPAIGRPERQLNEVCTGLLYRGFCVPASCLAAMRPNSAVLPFDLVTSADIWAGSRPDADWAEMFEMVRR